MKVRRPSTCSGSRAQPRDESVQARSETGTRRCEALVIFVQCVEGLNGETAYRSRVSALAVEPS